MYLQKVGTTVCQSMVHISIACYVYPLYCDTSNLTNLYYCHNITLYRMKLAHMKNGHNDSCHLNFGGNIFFIKYGKVIIMY